MTELEHFFKKKELRRNSQHHAAVFRQSILYPQKVYHKRSQEMHQGLYARDREKASQPFNLLLNSNPLLVLLQGHSICCWVLLFVYSHLFICKIIFAECSANDYGPSVMNVLALQIGWKDDTINKLLIRLDCNCFIDMVLMDMTPRCKQIQKLLGMIAPQMRN